MKVCVLTTSFPAYKGDIQSPFVYRFVKGIVQNGIQADVVCPLYLTSKNKREVLDGMDIFRFQYFPKRLQSFTEVGSIPDAIRTWKGKFQLPFFCLAYFWKALRVGRSADIVHAQWIIPSAFIGIFLKKVFGKPLVATTRGAELVLASKSRFFRPILKYTIRQCDFITSNNVNHVEMLRQLGASPEKTAYIPNGLDYDLYMSGDKRQARKKLKLAQEKEYILTVGYLIVRKRMNNIINAFAKIAQKRKNVELLIVGDGPLREELSALVKKGKLEDRVHFVGKVEPERVPLYLQASDVFVLASASEGRPNVVIEALASRLPVITTDVGDVTSFMRDGKEGFIIPIDNVNALAEKLQIVLQRPAVRARFVKGGYAAVRKSNPTWKESGAAYQKVYEKVLRD